MEKTSNVISSFPAFVSTKILEIGAGNISVGRYSGQFTARLLYDLQAQTKVLNHANKVIPRPWKGRFNHVIALSSDRVNHRHIHFKVNVNKIQFPNNSFHLV
jgi:tRNA/tmRNA/rRNA uracil-C5-methylase (TrmA/RlmC/RlmD family)